MATASEPFDGETVIDLLVNVCTALPPLRKLSPTMRDLIEPCLAIDPNDRPANGDELVSLIDQLSRVPTTVTNHVIDAGPDVVGNYHIMTVVIVHGGSRAW